MGDIEYNAVLITSSEVHVSDEREDGEGNKEGMAPAYPGTYCTSSQKFRRRGTKRGLEIEMKSEKRQEEGEKKAVRIADWKQPLWGEKRGDKKGPTKEGLGEKERTTRGKKRMYRQQRGKVQKTA